MNAFLNFHLNDKINLFEFVRPSDLAIVQLRNATAEAAETENTIVISSQYLENIEMHAVEVYTRKVYFGQFGNKLECEVYTLR